MSGLWFWEVDTYALPVPLYYRTSGRRRGTWFAQGGEFIALYPKRSILGDSNGVIGGVRFQWLRGNTGEFRIQQGEAT